MSRPGPEIIRRELVRKTFHLLTLAYLGAYLLLGYPRAAWVLGAWLAAVAAVEHGRLAWKPLNGLILRLFGGITRAEEDAQVSGAYYTSLGCWLTVALFGRHKGAVEGGILFLAFGDAAAAVAGRLWGRHPIVLGGTTKSWEGTSACLAVCFIVALAVGFPPGPAAAAAAAGALLELVPLPLNDNFWMPLGSAAVLWSLA